MARNPLATHVTINRKELLTFFDEKPEWSRKQVSAIIGVVGEDLNTACFLHYLASKGAEPTVLDDSVTTGRQKGPRLDRWIDVKWRDGSRTVFQTEIKNWSAHAISGKTLSTCASPEEVSRYKAARWEHRWDTERHTLKRVSHGTATATAKVLVKMKAPCGVDEEIVRPLLIFWEALGPRDKPDEHLFRIKKPTRDFPFDRPASWADASYHDSELWVFSVSSYLRGLDVDTIELHMPIAAQRLSILSQLFRTEQDAASAPS